MNPKKEVFSNPLSLKYNGVQVLREGKSTQNTPELEQKALNLEIFIQWCLHRKLTPFLVLVKDLSKYVFHLKLQFPRKKTLLSGEYCILSPVLYMTFHLELFLRKSKQQALIINSYFLGLSSGEMKWVYREKRRICICFLVSETGIDTLIDKHELIFICAKKGKNPNPTNRTKNYVCVHINVHTHLCTHVCVRARDYSWLYAQNWLLGVLRDYIWCWGSI